MGVEENAKIEIIVLECYKEYMKRQEGIPSLKNMLSMVNYYMEVNCYDMVYPEIFSIVNEEIVEKALEKNKYVFRKEGTVMCDAQNKIFEYWPIEPDEFVIGDQYGHKI